MKKLLVAAVAVLFGCFSAFAECDVSKTSNGRYSIVWSYNNPRADEVYIAGDFTNWDQGKALMEKTETGWTFSMDVPAGTVFKYKFVVDGVWTSDLKAPEFEKDGLGGQNGVVNVVKAYKLKNQPPKVDKKKAKRAARR